MNQTTTQNNLNLFLFDHQAYRQREKIPAANISPSHMQVFVSQLKWPLYYQLLVQAEYQHPTQENGEDVT